MQLTYETNRGTKKTVTGEYGESAESGKAWVIFKVRDKINPWRTASWSLTNPYRVTNQDGRLLGYFESAEV